MKEICSESVLYKAIYYYLKKLWYKVDIEDILEEIASKNTIDNRILKLYGYDTMTNQVVLVIEGVINSNYFRLITTEMT